MRTKDARIQWSFCAPHKYRKNQSTICPYGQRAATSPNVFVLVTPSLPVSEAEHVPNLGTSNFNRLSHTQGLRCKQRLHFRNDKLSRCFARLSAVTSTIHSALPSRPGTSCNIIENTGTGAQFSQQRSQRRPHLRPQGRLGPSAAVSPSPHSIRPASSNLVCGNFHCVI